MCDCCRFWAEYVNESTNTVKVIKLRCKQWSCPECAKDNTATLRKVVIEALENYLAQLGLTEAKLRYAAKLVTLTLPGREWRQLHGQVEADQIIKKNLDKLLKMLRKHWGVEAYMWVREFQGDGYPHIHMLLLGPEIADRTILQFIRDQWTARYEMGNVDIQLVKNVAGAGSYVVKYLSKSLTAGAPGGRVFSVSGKLREWIKRAKEDLRGDGILTKIGKMNSDGTFGPVFWERDSGEDLFAALEKHNLKILLDFFGEMAVLGSPQELLPF